MKYWINKLMPFFGFIYILLIVYLRLRSRFMGPINPNFNVITFITYFVLLFIGFIGLIYILRVYYHTKKGPTKDSNMLVKNTRWTKIYKKIYEFILNALESFMYRWVIEWFLGKKYYHKVLIRIGLFVANRYTNKYTKYVLIGLIIVPPFIVPLAYFVDIVYFREFYYFPNMAFLIIFTLITKAILYFLKTGAEIGMKVLEEKYVFTFDETSLSEVRVRDIKDNDTYGLEYVLLCNARDYEEYFCINAVCTLIEEKVDGLYPVFRKIFALLCLMFGWGMLLYLQLLSLL